MHRGMKQSVALKFVSFSLPSYMRSYLADICFCPDCYSFAVACIYMPAADDGIVVIVGGPFTSSNALRSHELSALCQAGSRENCISTRD